jgi:polyisoprenyl-phosphate glycosyltransferase
MLELSPQHPRSPESSKQCGLLSVVTAAYNETENLGVLYSTLLEVLDGSGINWEWIVVDDHSHDETFAVISELSGRDGRVRGVRFARNFGSHTAQTCGIHQAKGDCVVVLAADLQDPPQVIPSLLAQWRDGYQVVWAVRGKREGEKATTVGFARLYYWIMRNVVGLKEIPSTGADFYLIDRRVRDALCLFNEANVSILSLITWMGFRQTSIIYDKQARLHGKSGWTLEKKVKLVLDSVLSFSYLPVRLMSYAGSIVGLLGFAYAAFIVFNAIAGSPAEGWSSLMVIVLLLGGGQMMMMGILGEYLWRALDESRRRPRYLIEDSTSPQLHETKSNPVAAA